MGFIDDLKILSGKKENTPSFDEKPHEKKTVLIVEDEKPLATVLKDRLESEGYTVVHATNGEEGLQKVKEHHPNIVLLDLLMPVMSGQSMLIKLRDIPEFKKLPVIVLTNAGEFENIRVTQHYFNAVEFLIKSNVTMDEIVKRVKDFT